MRLGPGRGLMGASLFLLLSGVSLAQYDVGISVPNWSVPPYRSSGASSGLSTMTDISPGVAFVAMSPCRVFDTRGAVGPYGGPRLVANATRNFDIDSGPCTGIPAGVEAYSMNFGAILPDGQNSFVTIWPTGTAQPTVSALNPVQGVVVANAAIVPAGTGGSISVFPNTGVHLYGDINGYFSDELNTGNQTVIVGNIANQSVLHVDNASAVDGSRAILGNASAATGMVWGVLGHTNSNSVGSAGVRGVALASSGQTYGVEGVTLSTFGGSVGVRGESHAGTGVSGRAGAGGRAGVDGVLGSVEGLLGFNLTGTLYGLFSVGNAHVMGTLTATSKSFVEPHPSDPSKEIRYVSLEGPQAEVYFRGTAQVSRGVTRIPIPDDFRFVADPATYSTLVTPVGGMATVAVLSEEEDGIVVQASRDVRIHYVVYAERRAVKNPNPIAENVHFRPDPDRNLFAHLPDAYRQRMVQNGTLNPDGSVNDETARRLGWDKHWGETGRAPVPAN